MRWKLEDIEAALISMESVADSLKAARPTQPADWPTAVLYGVRTSFIRSFRHLYDAHLNHDIPLASWASRCLLELSVWNRYVLTSQDNAKRFYDDTMADRGEAIRSLPKDLSDAPDIEAAERYRTVAAEQWPFFDEQLRIFAESGISKHLDIRDVAKLVGLERRYTMLYRILSKLVHATAYSVIEIDNENAEEITGLLLDFGANLVKEYLLEIQKRLPPQDSRSTKPECGMPGAMH
jgi:hypothetical protein